MNADRIPVVGTPAIAKREGGVKSLGSIYQDIILFIHLLCSENSVEENSSFYGFT